MAFDEGLAQRVREALAETPHVTEKRMFGGLAFLYEGKMFVGIRDDSLMARVGKEAYDEALAQPHAREMDFTGRSLRGYVYVSAPGLARDADLARWVESCRMFVATLPAK